MPPQRKLSRQKIVETAILIANERGFKEVTLTAVANGLQVRLPSLYNHIDGIEDLRNHMRLWGMEMLTQCVLQEVDGKSGADALRGVTIGYRKFAYDYPGLYPQTLMMDQFSHPKVSAAWEAFLQITLTVMAGYGLSGEELIHAMRIMGSMMHGFVDVERAGGFIRSARVDESYKRMMDLFITGLDGFYKGGSGPSEEK